MSIIYTMSSSWSGKQPQLYIMFWENISLYKEYATVELEPIHESLENAVPLEITFTN